MRGGVKYYQLNKDEENVLVVCRFHIERVFVAGKHLCSGGRRSSALELLGRESQTDKTVKM